MLRVSSAEGNVIAGTGRFTRFGAVSPRFLPSHLVGGHSRLPGTSQRICGESLASDYEAAGGLVGTIGFAYELAPSRVGTLCPVLTEEIASYDAGPRKPR